MPEPFPKAKLESRCYQMHPLLQQQPPRRGMQDSVSTCLPRELSSHRCLLLEIYCVDQENRGLKFWGSVRGTSLARFSITLFVTSSLISVDVKPFSVGKRILLEMWYWREALPHPALLPNPQSRGDHESLLTLFLPCSNS